MTNLHSLMMVKKEGRKTVLFNRGYHAFTEVTHILPSFNVDIVSLGKRIVVDECWQVADRQSTGFFFVADPAAAVGPESIITSQNRMYIILDKEGNQVSEIPAASFTTPAAGLHFTETFNYSLIDPVDTLIQFDPDSQRFFAAQLFWYDWGMDTNVRIESGPNAGTTFAARVSVRYFGGQGNFSLSGEVVAVEPITAEPAITNGNALVGKIALIATDDFGLKDNLLFPSSTKVARAIAAGAIAVILYDNRDNAWPSQIDVFASGTVGDLAVVVSNVAASAIVNHDVTIYKNSPRTEDVRSVVSLAVSKNSNPQSVDDFYRYVIGGAIDDPDAVYPAIFPDYEKLSMSKDLVFIQSQDFDTVDGVFPRNNIISRTIALRKDYLINGGYPEYPNVIKKPQLALDLSQTNVLNLANEFEENTIPRYLETPIGSVIRGGVCAPGQDPDPHTAYFVTVPFNRSNTTPGEDILRLTKVTSSGGGAPSVVTMNRTIPSQDWTLPEYPSQGLFQTIVGPVQLRLRTIESFMYRCAQQCMSLWCTSNQINNRISSVHWYEFDLSAPGTFSIRQQGVIPTPSGVSAAYGAIDVNAVGEVMLAATLFGPNYNARIFHYARSPSDPLGTMSTIDPVESYKSPAPYYQNGPGPVNGEHLSRFNDFTSMDVDAHGSFYYYTECFMETSNSIVNLNAQGWFTCLFKSHIETITTPMPNIPQCTVPQGQEKKRQRELLLAAGTLENGNSKKPQSV